MVSCLRPLTSADSSLQHVHIMSTVAHPFLYIRHMNPDIQWNVIIEMKLMSCIGNARPPILVSSLSTYKQQHKTGLTSCRWAAATTCPPRPATEARSGSLEPGRLSRAGPDQPIRAIQPAGRTCRPPTGCMRQTSDSIIA